MLHTVAISLKINLKIVRLLSVIGAKSNSTGTYHLEKTVLKWSYISCCGFLLSIILLNNSSRGRLYCQ